MNSPSLTLAILSIVKNLVEVGQNIHKSFTKVSSPNYLRNAQHVAWDIQEMVAEVKAFCEGHVNMLEDVNDFHVALQSLLDKFRNFETLILPLLPQTGGRSALIWKHGNDKKIEERIVDLQSSIVKVMWRYMLRSTMRTKSRQKAYQERNGGALEGALEDTLATLSFGPPRATTENQPVIADHEIEYEVRGMLRSLEMLRLPASTPSIVAECRLTPMLEATSMALACLRNHVMRQINHIRELLNPEQTPTAFVFYESSYTLSALSVGLQQLDMGRQSIPVGNTAVKLARALVEAGDGGNADRRADLAACLHRQSTICYLNGNKIQGLREIDEAHTITRNLLSQHWVRAPFRILYSLVLTKYAEMVDDERSIKMTVEAVQVLEDILGTQAFTLSKSQEDFRIDNVARPRFALLNHLSKFSQASTMIPVYALALQNLGVFLIRNGQNKCALDLQRLAIAVRRAMVSTHGTEHRMHLARSLSSLVQGGVATQLPFDELIDMLDECIEIFQDLTEKNPRSHTRELVEVLQAKERVLRSQEKSSDAIVLRTETAGFTEKIFLEMQLMYHEESGASPKAASCDDIESVPPTWKASVGMGNFQSTDIASYPETPAFDSPGLAHDHTSARDLNTSSPDSTCSNSASFAEPGTFSTREGNYNYIAEKMARLSVNSFTSSGSSATTDYGSMFFSRE